MTDWLENRADLLFNNVAGWEKSTLQRIGKQINKIGKMSLADVKTINNIAVVKQDMNAVVKELAKVTGLNISQIEQIYADVLAEQHLANKPLYDYRGKKFVPFSENRELQAIARAYAKSTGETMINLANTKLLRTRNTKGQFVNMQKGYVEILDRAVMQVTSGATDFHSAMRESIIELGGSGVRVEYGGGVTRRIDAVVRQNILWGAKQASNEYSEMIGEELGCDGIEVDWHSNPRPNHEFMQGKQFVLGKARTINGVHFESAEEALERLQDYGCLHFKTPIICGVSEPRYSPEDLKRLNEQNAKTYDFNGKKMSRYEASQAMRRLETEVKKQKDIRELARASGDKALVKRCNERIKAYNTKYSEISEITGIPEELKQTYKPRIPKADSNITSPGANALTNSVDGGMIEISSSISSRNMANGHRRTVLHKLNKSEIETLRTDVIAIGADESKFIFNYGDSTSYSDKHDVVFVRGDVLPDINSMHPRDLMSTRAVLAHEYYGHRAHRGTKLRNGSWNDEFRASYSAAKNTPNLSDEDRRYLILDALERAKESGVSVRYNNYIRRVLYE